MKNAIVLFLALFGLFSSSLKAEITVAFAPDPLKTMIFEFMLHFPETYYKYFPTLKVIADDELSLPIQPGESAASRLVTTGNKLLKATPMGGKMLEPIYYEQNNIPDYELESPISGSIKIYHTGKFEMDAATVDFYETSLKVKVENIQTSIASFKAASLPPEKITQLQSIEKEFDSILKSFPFTGTGTLETSFQLGIRVEKPLYKLAQ